MAGNNGDQFSTRDRDNDGSSYWNCAQEFGGGGWWYKQCSAANLNAVYYDSPNTTDQTGIYWAHWHGYYYSLKASTIMVRKA